MKKVPVVIFFLLLATFVLARVPFLTREYAPEEPLWITAGEGVVATGFPIASLSQTRTLLPAYWKPPLLPITLGLAYKLFGSTELVSRGTMLFISLLQLPLILLLCRKLFGDKSGSTIGLVAIGLIAISPFAIQNAVYVEADASVLTLTLLIFLSAAWPVFDNESVPLSRWVFIAIAGVLALFARIETTLMVFLALALLTAWRWNRKKALAMIWACTAAIAFFFSLYWLHAMVYGHPEVILKGLKMIFAGVWLRFQNTAAHNPTSLDPNVYLPGVSLGPLAPILKRLFPPAAFSASVAVWYTLPFIFMGIYLLSRWIKEKFLAIKTRFFAESQLTAYIFLLAPMLIIHVVYGITGAGANWPRQLYFPFVLLAVFIAAQLVSNINALPTRRLWLLTGAGAALVILFIQTPIATILFAERTRSSPLLAASVIILTLAVALFLALRHPNLYLRHILIGVATLYIAGGIGLLIHDIKAPYTLTAYYGNYGYREAGQYLHNQIGPRETVVATDTIGYYYKRPYYDLIDQMNFNLNPDWVAVYGIPAGRFTKEIGNRSLVAQFGTVGIYH